MRSHSVTSARYDALLTTLPVHELTTACVQTGDIEANNEDDYGLGLKLLAEGVNPQVE